jgi:murein DD-endopeptidase MepM/ murein hydrolase activator NlpD
VAVALAAAGWAVSSAPARAASRPVAATTVASSADLPRSALLEHLMSYRAQLTLAAPHPAARVAPRASRSVARTPVVSHWVRPAYGAVTSPYGHRWGRMHKGVDIGAPYGAPIYAAFDGVISYAGPQGGYGRVIVIAHGDGISTAYGHMSSFVRTSGRVRAGDLIAYVGAAGDATGPHLHFEVRRDGAQFDPLPWLRSHGVRI